MHILYWIIISVGIFWLVIILLDRAYDLENRGFSIVPGFLMWRTKRGLGILDRLTGLSRRWWKAFAFAGAGVCSILMVLIFLNLTDKAIGIINSIISPPPGGGVGVPAIVPIVPGWTIPFKLIVPVLIGIATVFLVHEPAHGITARRVGLPVKSTGLFLLAVIPGAFVEPDEDKLKESPVSDRLQVYGAGSFANVLFGLLCFGLILILINPLPGLYVVGVDENAPASGNLQPGMRLMKIGHEKENLIEINTWQIFDNFMKNTEPGDNITLVTDEGDFRMTLENHPDENVGYIGVVAVESASRLELATSRLTPLFIFWKTPSGGRGSVGFMQLFFGYEYSYDYHVPGFIISVLFWMSLLNIGIGLVNILPLKPLDGGHIAECLSEKASSKKTAKGIASGLSVITLLIVIINLMVWIL